MLKGFQQFKTNRRAQDSLAICKGSSLTLVGGRHIQLEDFCNMIQCSLKSWFFFFFYFFLLSLDPDLPQDRKYRKGLETGAWSLKSLPSRDVQRPAGVSALSFCHGSGPTPPGPFPTAVQGGAVRTPAHERLADSSMAARICGFLSPKYE